MNEILNGFIFLCEKGQKIVKTSEKSYKLSPNTEVSDLSIGSYVKFTLEKRIFSDKTEIFAQIHDSSDKKWDKIYHKFLNSENKSTLSEYQTFLKRNYNFPEEKIKI